MNIVVVITPVLVHVSPLLPLIRAFPACGDRVTVTAAGDARTVVTSAGAEFCGAFRRTDVAPKR